MRHTLTREHSNILCHHIFISRLSSFWWKWWHMPPLLAPFFSWLPSSFPLLVSWWSEMQLYVGALTWERKDIWQQGSASNRNVCKSISEERGEFGRRRSSLLKGQCGLYNYPQLTQRDKRSIARAIWLPFRLSIEKKVYSFFPNKASD